MLTKVIKHEFKSCAGLSLLFGLALVSGVMVRISWQFILPLFLSPVAGVAKELLIALFGVLQIVIVMLVFIGVLYRFFVSTTGKQAYLTFTLPVKISTLIWGRIWTGLAFVIGSVLVMLVSFGIAGVFDSNFLNPRIDLLSFGSEQGVTTSWGVLVSSVDWKYILVLLVFLVVGIAMQLTQMYACIAIGSKFPGNTLLGSVVAYLLFSNLEGIVGLLLVGIPAVWYIGGVQGAEQIVNSLLSLDQAALVQQIVDFSGKLFLLLTIVLMLMTAIHFMVTLRMYKNNLNIE